MANMKFAHRKEKAMQKLKRVRTTLNLPEDLWKAVKICAIERGINAQDLVALALQQFLKKGGAK